ncbi:UNVERIFIED_CONTAM: Peroxisome biogenesis protein 1 [Sesamum indicum]
MLTWNAISHKTKGFSGADLQALLSDTQLEAVHLLLDMEDGSGIGNMPIITGAPLEPMASKAKCLNHEFQKLRSEGCMIIYSQFLNSKWSVTEQVYLSFSLIGSV